MSTGDCFAAAASRRRKPQPSKPASGSPVAWSSHQSAAAMVAAEQPTTYVLTLEAVRWGIAELKR
jgi:hypothetical protein